MGGGFIQTITYSTSRFDEVLALAEEFRAKRVADGTGPTPVRISICADRDVSGRYTSVIEFASYEDALANSQRADTTEFARALGELCDGPPVFANLDVIRQDVP